MLNHPALELSYIGSCEREQRQRGRRGGERLARTETPLKKKLFLEALMSMLSLLAISKTCFYLLRRRRERKITISISHQQEDQQEPSSFSALSVICTLTQGAVGWKVGGKGGKRRE